MRLVERHIIKSTDSRYKDFDELCLKSKNLYNQALYRVRQQFFIDKTYKDYYAINREMCDENQVDYRALPANTSQETLKLVHQNYSSFFNAFKFTPSGSRMNRGLYKTKDGMLINADVNGGLNILRKQLNVVCDDIICPADIGFVMNPLKINFHK